MNECAEGSHNCSQYCSNTAGSYECSCRDGYQLDDDGRSCNGIIFIANNYSNLKFFFPMHKPVHNGTPTTTESVAVIRSPSAFELASIAGVGIILLLLTIVVICVVTYFILRRKRKYELKTIK